MLEVTLLGCGGMLPMKDRWLTSCLISCQGHSILVDCGEGTQIALKCAKRKTKPIDLICITHFHADHISGLPGFLLSMGNEGREEPVTIAGPAGIERIVNNLCVIAPNLPFDIKFTEISEPHPFKSELLTVTPFEAAHSVRCLGYSFVLERKGKFLPEKARKNGVPMCIWSELQKEGSAVYNEKIYTYDDVSEGTRKGIKLTYCTDSRPINNIAAYARNADLLICEGLYYEPEKINRAIKTGHMIYSEAAGIAEKANVKKLWLTHFSPAVTDPEAGIGYAKKIFPTTECGFDGKYIDINFEPQSVKST